MRRFNLQKVVLCGLVAGLALLGVASSAEAQGPGSSALQGGLGAGLSLGIMGGSGHSPTTVHQPKQNVQYQVIVMTGHYQKLYDSAAQSRAVAFFNWIRGFGQVKNVQIRQLGNGPRSGWKVTYTVTQPWYVGVCRTEAEGKYLQKRYNALGMRCVCVKR